MLSFFSLRRSRACIIALALCAGSKTARADSACPISVEPATVDATWNEKAQEAASTLSKPGENQNDCRSIRIEVQPEGNALLTFTTTDGRIAVRLLHSPSDIFPIVEALLVTLPVERPLEKTTPSPAPSATPNPIPPPAGKLEHSSNLPKVTRTPPMMLVRAYTGTRVAIEAGMLAPIIGLQTTVQFELWEMGLGGEINPQHLPLGATVPTGYLLRTFEGNILIGRRFPWRKSAFRAGASLGIAIVHEQTDDDPATKGHINIDAFQPRIGAYGGLLIPREGRFRFYMGLQGDVALWGIRDNGTTKKDLPALSRFGLGLCLGMEVAP